jgi:hypothetical protein
VTVETYGVEQLLRDLREYTCPVHGCEASLSSGSLLCRGHWRLVPSDLKREVWEAVRKIDRIGKRYETAQDGSPRQARLADEWLGAETICREVQLRAVIVASERAGARPDDVGSAGQTTPRKGGCMKIKTSVNSDGCATVAIINPETQETIDTRSVEPGQEVEITAVNAHDPADLQVGEVCAIAAPVAGEGGEGAQDAGAGEGGEAAGAGEGEAAAGEGAGEGSATGEGESATP